MIEVSGCKSVTNRVLILSAIADSPTTLINSSNSNDSNYLKKALRQLRLKSNGKHRMYIGDGGTSARFLLALLSCIDGKFIIRCGDQLSKRPFDKLLQVLGSVRKRGNEFLVNGRAGLSVDCSLVEGESSQFISALMLSSSLRPKTIIEYSCNMNSWSYVRLTLDVMRKFGVKFRLNRGRFVCERQKFSGRKFTIPSDVTVSAIYGIMSYFLGRSVRFGFVRGDVEPAESAMFSVLKSKLGFRFKNRAGVLECFPPAKLSGFSLNARDMPDTALTLMILGAFCTNIVHITGLDNLKYKESSRLESMSRELDKLGIRIKTTSNSIKIHPSLKFKTARLLTYGDHRLSMNFHILKLVNPGICVEETDSISKSYPNFLREVAMIHAGEYRYLKT